MASVSVDEPVPTGPEGEPLEDFLAQVIARHFDEGWVERPDDDSPIAHLGLGGIRVLCPPPRSLTDQGSRWAAMLTVRISGGAFGSDWQAVNLSGYGQSPDHAILEAGCVWACSFGGLLKSAFAGAPLDEKSAQAEVTLDGRQFLSLFTAVDRWVSADQQAGELAARAVRDACGGWLTSAVLGSGTLPVIATDTAVSLGTFLGVVNEPLPEVKVHGGDWPSSFPALTRAAPAASGAVVLLRDHAILLPRSPFAGFERASLQRTLADIGTHRGEPGQTAGWRGWRRHGGRLGAALSSPEVDALRRAAGGPLPPAYEHFVATVAATGAGPGYGLEPPVVRGSAIVLAVAGCGIHWELRLAGEGRGEVWLDAEVLDEPPHPVAASFTQWYAGWLDAAVRDNGPWRQWDNRGCSPVGVLNQVFEQAEREHPGEAEARVQAMGSEATVRVTGFGELAGRVLDPCHPCVALYAEFDWPEAVFAIGYPSIDQVEESGWEVESPHPGAGGSGERRRGGLWNRLRGKG